MALLLCVKVQVMACKPATAAVVYGFVSPWRPLLSSDLSFIIITVGKACRKFRVSEMIILVAEPQTEPATWQAESASPVARTAQHQHDK